MSQTLRTFIAVKVRLTRRVSELLEELGQLGRAIRPVRENQLHVTLKFLGDLPESQLDDVRQILRQVVSGQPAFPLQLTGLGAFPTSRRPSVVWIGLRDQDQKAAHATRMIEMAGTLDRELSRLGIPRESRSFHPHLTVARIKGRPPERLGQLLEEHADTAFGPQHFEAVYLIKSELRPQGARYSDLEEVVLQAGDV